LSAGFSASICGLDQGPCLNQLEIKYRPWMAFCFAMPARKAKMAAPGDRRYEKNHD
jgi:hypothetical protein